MSQVFKPIQSLNNADQFIMRTFTRRCYIKYDQLYHKIQSCSLMYIFFQLQVGKLYEVVVTNAQGLCRYRVGDIVKVVGFKGKTPQYTFQYT